MDWVEIIVNILALLVAIIPLAAKLVEYVRLSVKEKNWSNLLVLVMNLMQEAESKFSSGAERKEWVVSMVKASSKTINYDVDLEQIGELIDSLCKMSKVVN